MHLKGCYSIMFTFIYPKKKKPTNKTSLEFRLEQVKLYIPSTWPRTLHIDV